MAEKIRSPIIVTVGHVDHGKTSLLDKIRGTAVTKLEPGQLSQHVGASYIPLDTVKKICGDLSKKMKIQITIPGLLLLDTPGHAAFITLRRRGGSVSDLAILVVDITEGFQEQTSESVAVLKEFKTPFVVAATKVDKIPGWYPTNNSCFLDTFNKQSDDVKDDVEKKVYTLVSQLAEHGFNGERFDRVDNFTKQVAIVPCSSKTGEGVADLLVVLAGLAQQFLKDKLALSEIGKGTVLEVKEVRGFGLTIDVILYDGSVRKNDWMVIGGREPVVTKVKALLRPKPLKELRVEKQFESVDEVHAAAGIKVAALNIENVIAGSPIVFVTDEKDVEDVKRSLQQEVEEIEFEKDVEGVVLKADTLGSLEAMIKLVKEEGISIRKAEVGNINKQDVSEAQNVKDELKKVILAFNVKVLPEAEDLAEDLKVKIFNNVIIYRIFEEYREWCYKRKERELQEKLAGIVHPARVKVLGGDFVFRASHPAIFGVEVRKGLLRKDVLLRNEEGKIVGRVKEIQKEGKQIEEAKEGDMIAVSMEEVTFGRQVKTNDVLSAVINDENIQLLKELKDKLTLSERELLEEISKQ